MDDKDHVFARFKDDRPAPADRRETLSIPRRAGATGSRMVEVVHIRSGRDAKDRPRRLDPQVVAASWEDGFPARVPKAVPAPAEPELAVAAAAPKAHVMPAWEPTPVEPEAVVAAGPPPPRAPRSAAPARRVAAPFDAEDDGANCMRCGYALEAERERRGLLTCGRCG